MENNIVTEEDFRKGAQLFARFWLRPQKYATQSAKMRIKVNTKWMGWKIKEELIEALKLEVGNTICAEVTPLFMPDIIDEDDEIKLFVPGDLIESLLDNNISTDSVFDCQVCFLYAKAPIGPNGKDVYTVSLRLDKIINVCKNDSQSNESDENDENDENDVDDLLDNILQNME